jgi:dihydroxyacetone kinase phosphoprotein-dependent L subunit
MTAASDELPVLREVVHAVGDALRREEQRLCDLDAAVGDGDHGLTMVRCWTLVERAANGNDAASVAEVLEGAGRAVLAGGGGAIGPLLGTALMAAGRAAHDSEASPAAGVAEMLLAAASEVSRRGGALAGDRTLLDALTPAAVVAAQVAAIGATTVEVVAAAADVADDAALATATMVGRAGRAARLGERAIGHPDPGAVSVAIILRAAADRLEALAARGARPT